LTFRFSAFIKRQVRSRSILKPSSRRFSVSVRLPRLSRKALNSSFIRRRNASSCGGMILHGRPRQSNRRWSVPSVADTACSPDSCLHDPEQTHTSFHFRREVCTCFLKISFSIHSMRFSFRIRFSSSRSSTSCPVQRLLPQIPASSAETGYPQCPSSGPPQKPCCPGRLPVPLHPV